MTVIDSLQFLPESLRNHQLYIKICDIINDIRNDNLSTLQDVISKYRDFDIIDSQAVTKTINEFGYQYIIDVLDIDDVSKRTILSYISLIHFLKGHKSGLELVLRLLDISYVITEWWEQMPIGEPHSFNLDININTSTVTSDTTAKLRIFINQYVYPKLNFKLIFNLESSIDTGITGILDQVHTCLVDIQGVGHGFNFGESFGDDNP